jgi:hypothetical protein
MVRWGGPRRLARAVGGRHGETLARRHPETAERLLDRRDGCANDADGSAEVEPDLVGWVRVGGVGDDDVDGPSDRIVPHRKREQALAEPRREPLDEIGNGHHRPEKRGLTPPDVACEDVRACGARVDEGLEQRHAAIDRREEGLGDRARGSHFLNEKGLRQLIRSHWGDPIREGV